jgi:N-dimethylarginine dimethylaminohydrolase
LKEHTEIYVNNEVGKLRTVVLGIAFDFGGAPDIEQCYDPKSIESIRLGIFPLEKDLIREMNAFLNVFQRYGVRVYRPQNIPGLNQIYARDIAFVIENKLIIPNVIEERSEELSALNELFQSIDESHILKMPKNARAEGGDVILNGDSIFIGYSEDEDFDTYKVARTNLAGVEFIEKSFPDKKIRAFELLKSDTEPMNSALHLDCCFQPIGENMAILCEKGFKNRIDFEFLLHHFGEENTIVISEEDMYNMNSNVFSLSKDVIVSQTEFTRLNSILRDKGFKVEEISYKEISKMGGLFRCSTMPLLRE